MSSERKPNRQGSRLVTRKKPRKKPPRKKPSSNIAVELTQRALNDLREIERYSVREWGRSIADKYLDNIAAALDRLRENPRILRVEQNFSHYLFFYRVNRHFLVCDYQGETIIVLTVIHTSMDIPTRLLELEPRLAEEAKYLFTKLHSKPDKD